MPAMGTVASPRQYEEAALLERSEFAETLDESLAVVASGGGRLVLVSGEAGIGKSALVRRFCASHAEGARVLWGTCDALGTPRPLSPLIDIAAAVEGHLLASVRTDDKPHTVFVALLEELTAVRPTIAVIEDVHWADEATLDVIRLLARRAEALGALVVVTYREDELEPSHPVRLAVGELGTAPGVTQLRLPPLSHDAVAELARPRGVDAGELYERTAGNPFFVTEVLAGGGTDVPPTVRDAVLARMSRLGAPARGVLEAVAVVSPNAEMWVLDRVLGDEVAQVDTCLAAGMLRSEGSSVSFRHELARLAVEQSIGPYRRVILHRRVLAALERPPEGVSPDPAQLAHHADAAGDAIAALRHATAAGARAASQGAHREAVAQYARAVRFAGSLSPAELAALLERLAQECYLTNQIDAAAAAQEHALECYRELGDRRSEAVALCALSEMIWCGGYIAESESAGREAVEALAGLEPGRELARAFHNLATLSESPETATEWALRAGTLAERLGDRQIELRARIEMDAVRYHDSGDGEARRRLEESLELAVAGGFELEAGSIWFRLARAALRHRAYADVDRYVEDGLAHSGQCDLEVYERYLRAFGARAALDRGRWGDATDAANIVLHDPGPSIVPLVCANVVVGLARARAGSPGASELLERAVPLAERHDRASALAEAAAARAELAWLEGRADAIEGVTDAAFARALRQGALPEALELARWRRRAGLRAGGGRRARARRRGARRRLRGSRAAVDGARLPVRGRARADRRG